MAAGLFYVYTDPGSVDEAEFHDWYDHEHGPARLTVPGPGWRRIRRFRLTRALDGPGPGDPGDPDVPEPGSFLSGHELADPEVLEDPGYRAAVSTPWRDRVVASALRRERRMFGLRNAIGA